ncbi:MAG: DUF3618 domain-containing protein [Acidobacteria bacterium]|nr:DUF3618 domain-containing protein [Acidobacteriota bacterium]
MSIIDSATQEAKAGAAKARADLADTLDAIEDKLNIAKRVGELSDRAAISYRQHPMPFLIGGAIAAAVTVGLVAWAIFSDD